MRTSEKMCFFLLEEWNKERNSFKSPEEDITCMLSYNDISNSRPKPSFFFAFLIRDWLTPYCVRFLEKMNTKRKQKQRVQRWFRRVAAPEVGIQAAPVPLSPAPPAPKIAFAPAAASLRPMAPEAAGASPGAPTRPTWWSPITRSWAAPAIWPRRRKRRRLPRRKRRLRHRKMAWKMAPRLNAPTGKRPSRKITGSWRCPWNNQVSPEDGRVESFWRIIRGICITVLWDFATVKEDEKKTN